MRNAAALIVVAVLPLVAVTPAGAQDEGTKTPVAHDQVISASPILLTLKWFNADYERKVSSTLTWGVSGSYLPVGCSSYARVSLLVRYYPQRAALAGFYFGGQAGVYRIADAYQHESAPGVGADIGYAWLFGPKRNIGVSLGFGVSRVFPASLHGASVVIPNARLFNIGIAF